MAATNSQSDDNEQAVNAKRVAKILGVADITLTQWRQRGGGPPWFRVGTRSVRYRLSSVLAWRDSRTVGSAK